MKLEEITIYEDENILILNKPVGILSQNDGTGSFSLESLINNSDVHLINRLDKDTSGLIVFGKNENAISFFNNVFQNHEKVTKTYLILVEGIITENGIVDAPIRKNFEKKKMVIAPISSGAKNAKTLYNPVEIFDDSTLLEVTLLTGRTHQIRVHMSYLRHHVIGDYKYGDFKINNIYKSKYGVKSQLLHSYSLAFNDLDEPFNYLNGKIFSAELPENFSLIIKMKKENKSV